MSDDWIYPSHIPREPDKAPMGKPNWGEYALWIAGLAAFWTIAWLLNI